MIRNIDRDREIILLRKFNNRDEYAFGEVYSMFYHDIVLYASMLYRTEVVHPADVVQDIFVKLWQSPNIHFDALYKVKSYVYIAVKNDFRDFISHNKHIEKYRAMISLEENFQIDIIENETYSMIERSLNVLPEECFKIMKMFLDGWKPGEIAEQLGCSQQTVYNHKYEAIQILRKKFNNNNKLLFTMLTIFS